MADAYPNNIKCAVQDGRLRIEADVDLVGLQKLATVLTVFEDVLTILYGEPTKIYEPKP